MADTALKLHIWPFSGLLADILTKDAIVAIETYPTEFYHQLGITFAKARRGEKSGKRVQTQRAKNAAKLLVGACQLNLNLEQGLMSEIEAGFGTNADGEDRFDAFVGLFGMLKVLRSLDKIQEPEDSLLRKIEGCIFGQSSSDV